MSCTWRFFGGRSLALMVVGEVGREAFFLGLRAVVVISLLLPELPLLPPLAHPLYALPKSNRLQWTEAKRQVLAPARSDANDPWPSYPPRRQVRLVRKKDTGVVWALKSMTKDAMVVKNQVSRRSIVVAFRSWKRPPFHAHIHTYIHAFVVTKVFERAEIVRQCEHFSYTCTCPVVF